MTEQQITDFDRWFDRFLDPELNLTPGDKELCRHAWQAALSHAEGEAVPVAEITIDRHGDAHFKACPNYLDLDQGTYQLYTHPAPQVAVPEGWEIWTDDHGDLRVSGTAERLPTGRQHRETVWLGPEPETPELWLFRKLCDRLLAAAPTAPAGEPECCRSQPCKRPGTGPCDMPAAQQPVSDPDGLPGTPRPMSTAPRDGTMVRLLVQFTENGVNDGFDSGPAWTIGANTYDDSGDDEWFIAGWNWQQDCFTAGEGEPLGWLPMLSAPAPDEREIAAKAINDAAQYAQDWIEKQGAVTPESAAALDAVQAYSNSLEKKS